MEFIKISAMVLLSAYFFAFFIILIKTARPLKWAILNAFYGIWFVLIINLTSFLSGVHIPVNYFSVLVSAFLGIPGDILLLVLKYFVF